ncbi:hypothetical protein N9570_04745 [Candidatus Pelagibacter sp.]|nr:hypothetical protein [Candidatus Pelagibacter sp.]
MILIRVDSGSKVGLGHYIRIQALIKYLKIKNYKIIVDKISNESFFKKEKGKIISLYENNKFISELNDAKLFLKFFKKKYVKPIVIKDSYRLNYKWEKYLAKYCKKIISIDDFLEKRHYSDIYINHSPSLNFNQNLIEIIKKNNKKFCKLLLGTNFALFNSSAKKINTKKSDLTFYNGGSGNILIYKNIIQKLLKIKNFNYKINLIVGPYAKNFKVVEKLFSKNKLIKVINQPENIISYIKNTKLFISTASTAMYESSLAKTPTLLFKIYDNQNLFDDKSFEQLGHYFILNKQDITCTDKVVNIVNLMLDYNKDIIKMMNKTSINLKNIKKNYIKNLKL